MTSEASRKRRGLAAGVLAGVLTLAVAGCADFERGEPSPPKPDAGGQHADGGGPAEGGAGLSFATAVYPLLTTACPRCHAAGQQAGDTHLLFTGAASADYSTVVMFIDTSAPAGSRLLAKMSGNG